MGSPGAPRHPSASDPAGRIIFALDVPTPEEACRYVTLLKSRIAMFKIGMELFTAYGKEAVEKVQEAGGPIFLDLKFHDIPNTVSRAGEEAVRLGVEMFNLHAAGGFEMMHATGERARQMAKHLNRARPILLAVTVLTSLDEKNLAEIGMTGPIPRRAEELAALAQRAGMDGVVASPQEIAPIRQRCGPDFLIVTPGIRPAFVQGGKDDQRRVMTAREAIKAGADYLVIGRPIRQAKDPVAAVDQILQEIS
jgi:orotidine-5'-phosphate decarboxylase